MVAALKSHFSDPVVNFTTKICWPLGIVTGVMRFTLFYETRTPTVSIDDKVIQSPVSSTAVDEIIKAVSMSDFWVSLMFLHEVLLGIVIVHGASVAAIFLFIRFISRENTKVFPAASTVIAVAVMSYAAYFAAEIHLWYALVR